MELGCLIDNWSRKECWYARWWIRNASTRCAEQVVADVTAPIDITIPAKIFANLYDNLPHKIWLSDEAYRKKPNIVTSRFVISRVYCTWFSLGRAASWQRKAKATTIVVRHSEAQVVGYIFLVYSQPEGP
jgi:hypothetical protein